MQGTLPAGWVQRLAWTALVWGSLGMLAWVPFFYVALRRGRPSDWGAFASFVLYEAVTLPWSAVRSGEDDSILGVAVIVTLLTATAMLLFALFDRKPPRRTAYGPPAFPPPAQGNPYWG